MRLTLEKVTLRVGAEQYLYDIKPRTRYRLMHVLLGPTQSGKTSLMRIMAGLDRPSTGRVLADEKDVTGVSVRARNVAMVYQQFVNYPSFTVFDNIASPLRLAKRYTTAEVDRKVRAAVK